MAGKWTSGRRKTIPMPQEIDDYKPPVKPKSMADDAEWLWDTSIKPMIDSRSVDESDSWALVSLCDAWSDYRAARKLALEAPDNLRLAMLCNMHVGRMMKLAKPYGLNRQLREKLGSKQKASGIVSRQRA